MGHGGGHLDEAFHTAERFGQCEDLRVVHEVLGRLGAGRELHGDDAAEAAVHLAGGDFMTRVGLEARVPDALNHIRGLGFEPFGHLQGVGTVALDAQIQGLQAADVQPGVERGGHCAGGVLQEGDLLAGLLIVDHHGTADHVGVAADVLGGGVDHHIGAIGQRVLKGGRGEGVVDSDLGAVLVGDFGGGRDVGDVEQRVGRSLDPHILVVLGGQCGFHGFQIGDVHHVEAHTPRHEHLGEQAVGAAVHIVAEQDVVAGLDGGAQQHVDGGQARGEAQRVLAAFHGGELLVEACASGVDGAGVVVASPEAQHAILLESGGGEDRRDDRTGGRVGLLAGVDGASGDVGVGELGVVFSGHDIGFLSGSFRIRR